LFTCTQPNDHILTSEFSFDMYQVRSDATGRKLTKCKMADQFFYSVENLNSAITPQTRIIFIANPNNPTGTVLSLNQIEQIAIKAMANNCLVVVDEAYFEFGFDIDPQNQKLNGLEPIGFMSADKLIGRYPNIVVMRTFSKLYGLASLRIGYGIMHPHLAELMNRVRLPFNVGLPNQAAAIAAINDTSHVAKTVSNNSEQLPWLRKNLQSLGFEVLPSWANFVWCKSPILGATLYQKLLEKGVIIRTNTDPRLKDYVRISIGTPEENEILVHNLRLVLAN